MKGEYKLTITKDEVKSTDGSFTIDDLNLGNNYKPNDAYFVKNDGAKTVRKLEKGERYISNQTLPRIAFQIYEEKIAELTEDKKREFPICRYKPNDRLFKGIFSSSDDFKNYRKTIEYLTYTRSNKQQFVIYCWNIFTTIYFVQECLKRFGDDGDKFVLEYSRKAAGDEVEEEPQEPVKLEYKNKFTKKLIESKNIIFRGAPGTGKTFLAKQIAADIVSKGETENYNKLSDDQKMQIEFVQFHPSYDYTDFVEGLRPKLNNGTMNFELQDGIFKRFCAKAKMNFEAQSETRKDYVFIIDEINRGEISKIFGELFFAIDPGYRGIAGEVSTQYATLHPNNEMAFYVPDNVYIIGTMNDIDRSVETFDFAMRRRFRFIELKANAHIGMFETIGNDDLRNEAIQRMERLNNEIVKIAELNENNQIGAAYFMKLKNLTSEELWTDYLKPLLQEYIHGMPEEEEFMQNFKDAYSLKEEND